LLNTEQIPNLRHNLENALEWYNEVAEGKIRVPELVWDQLVEMAPIWKDCLNDEIKADQKKAVYDLLDSQSSEKLKAIEQLFPEKAFPVVLMNLVEVYHQEYLEPEA